MKARHVCAAVVAALATLGTATTADAAKWREVTPNQDISALAAPGLARTADGVLHVAWPREQGLGGTVVHSAVSASGKSVSGPNDVFSYTGGLSHSIALIRVDEGLRAFFSGLMDVSVHPQQTGVETALSGDGGASWTASRAVVATSKAYTAGIGAVQGPANVPLFAWGDTDPGSAGYHVGVSPATPDTHYGQTTTCCEYAPNVAVDGLTGQEFLAYKFIYPDNVSGTSVQPIGGGLVHPPGADAAETEIRPALTGRIGAGGVYLAYQRGTNQFLSRAAVWNATTGKPVDNGLFGKQKRVQAIGIASGADGRLWVFWRSGSKLFGTRSNKQATRFGALVKVATLKGNPQLMNLAGEGSRGPLDVIAVFRKGSGDDASLWHNRLLPGLSLAAKVKGHKVTFTVTDA